MEQKRFEKLYELKKDVSAPNGYWRAGATKTMAEWEDIWPDMTTYEIRDWFIDLSEKKDADVVEDESAYNIVAKVFGDDLRSITYREMAAKACIKYHKIHSKK